MRVILYTRVLVQYSIVLKPPHPQTWGYLANAFGAAVAQRLYSGRDFCSGSLAIK